MRHYARAPPDQRPDVAREQGLVALLKEVLKHDLLAAEARARGLEESTEFRERVQLNRNSLVRMWAQDRVSQEATAWMQAPDIDARVRRWYRENLERLYTVRDDAGRERRLSFEEEEERIRNDYADHLREKVRAERARALRGVHKIVVDDQVLAKS